MRLVFLLTLIGLFAFAGCGPSKPKPSGKPEPEPNVPTIEPPPDPKEKDPVAPDKTPVTPDKSPMPAVPAQPATPEAPKTSAVPVAPADVAGLIDSLKKAESREDALAGLKAKGVGVVPTLISALDTNTDARQGLLVALGSFGKDAAAALPSLKKLFESEKDPATRDTVQFTIDAIEGN